MLLEFNHAHTVMIEDLFTIAERGGVRANLELLGEIATKLPDLLRRLRRLLAWIPEVSVRCDHAPPRRRARRCRSAEAIEAGRAPVPGRERLAILWMPRGHSSPV